MSGRWEILANLVEGPRMIPEFRQAKQEGDTSNVSVKEEIPFSGVVRDTMSVEDLERITGIPARPDRGRVIRLRKDI